MPRRNSHIDAAISELTSHGAQIVGIATDGRHPRVRYRMAGGPERFVVVPCTPSDSYRGPLNTRSDVRKAAGLVRVRRERGERVTRRRPPAAAALPPPEITVLPDPMIALAEHEHAAEVTRLRLERAYAGFWEECLASVGCEPWWRAQGAREKEDGCHDAACVGGVQRIQVTGSGCDVRGVHEDGDARG